MGSERRASLRPNREDGPSGLPSLLGGPAMDALDEHLAPTRIDLRDARPRLRGRVEQAVTSPGETPPRRRVLGPTRGWHMAAGMLEARPTPTGDVPSQASSRPAPRRHRGRHGIVAQGTPAEVG